MPTYKCIALEHPVFGPAMRLIASITNATIPTVTTTFAHGYVDGTIVRFDIPPALGMQQINQMTSAILVTGLTTFTIAIDTTNFEPFVIPVGTAPQVDICGLVVPIGEVNETLKAAVRNLLPNQV
jgi:hypothetical protein